MKEKEWREEEEEGKMETGWMNERKKGNRRLHRWKSFPTTSYQLRITETSQTTSRKGFIMLGVVEDRTPKLTPSSCYSIDVPYVLYIFSNPKTFVNKPTSQSPSGATAFSSLNNNAPQNAIFQQTPSLNFVDTELEVGKLLRHKSKELCKIVDNLNKDGRSFYPGDNWYWDDLQYWTANKQLGVILSHSWL
ncbi:hypothetical protein K435DRAFT_809886 [Dendrothele bispora CBS 962.96]|uniref:Uncharacterized protein n=1 Tax=Dendrothele bispora (strain CBS 962.96) TaxID=1314807 RepID=A0A4S8KX77_DENBC|nr:hypothetical protein K435DRAFT_809886 [Dendrothele bispora CBS 962.96]